ncbi:hypothetical protein PoB_001862300 [Plakobranchus ocellatus]|uniref:Secreted protein n=1 Tax=Plakobranchus ocellatus TaxID=259542 RepID=A0AAV3ZBL5_9GAST|nr:hypothetical protein PoB_001862300 [Plakobranchus ocellatus]
MSWHVTEVCCLVVCVTVLHCSELNTLEKNVLVRYRGMQPGGLCNGTTLLRTQYSRKTMSWHVTEVCSLVVCVTALHCSELNTLEKNVLARYRSMLPGAFPGHESVENLSVSK